MVSISTFGGGAPSAASTQTQRSVSVAKATFSSTEVAAKGAETDEVVTLSKSMEKLLDSFTGGRPAKLGNDNSRKPDGDTGSGGGGSTGQYKSEALDRAREAVDIMDRVQQAGDNFAKGLGKALDGMADMLGSTLGQLGMSSDDVKELLGGFKNDMAGKSKELLDTLSRSPDFSQMTLDYQSSATEFSIETSGIDLVIQDGDRKMVVSYAKSTLDLRREDGSVQAQVGGDGSASVSVGASTTTAQGKAEGMIVNAKGFSADEVQQVLDRLNDLRSGSGSSVSLTPEKRADGTLKLKLDLSAIIPPPESQASGAAGATSTGTAAAAGSSAAAQTPRLNIAV